MIVGGVYYFVSDQATGYESRRKYHLYIGEGNYRHQGHIFLFISSSNTHSGYSITRPPYGFLRLTESFISTNSIVSYEIDDMSIIAGDCLGRLSPQHMKELRSEIADSDAMAADEIQLVCQALDGMSRDK
jgi:hypothetical protein